MKKRIELHKKPIEYTLKLSNRARRMRLTIYCDGSFVVTAPRTIDESLIERFIIRKSQWILDKIAYFKKISNKIINKTDEGFESGKNKALALVEKRLDYFNKIYGFSFNKINIKNQKTRWGSCSRRKNLNFNYKIISLPEKIADYIIVHELCHLKEFNHSQKFWNLVAKAIPDYLEIRNKLDKSRLNSLRP